MSAVLSIISSLLVSSGAHADLGLLSPAALRDARSAWVILDARPPAAYHTSHIEGAYSFSWEDHTRTDAEGVRYRPWAPGELATAFGGLGITERSGVLVYGDADASWGGEGWTLWLLASLGHEGSLRLLDGGLEAWTDAGEALVSTPTEPAARAIYHVRLQPDLDITTAELRERGGAYSIVDVRSLPEWLAGHIPGAVHVPWDDFHEGNPKRPLEPEALRALLTQRGVRLDRPIVYYCAGGVRSAYAWLAQELAGIPGARNYAGGFEAWVHERSDLPNDTDVRQPSNSQQKEVTR